MQSAVAETGGAKCVNRLPDLSMISPIRPAERPTAAAAFGLLLQRAMSIIIATAGRALQYHKPVIA